MPWDNVERRKKENGDLRLSVTARLIAHRRIKEQEKAEAEALRAEEAGAAAAKAEEEARKKKETEGKRSVLHL